MTGTLVEIHGYWTTLWLAIYYKKTGQIDRAENLLSGQKRTVCETDFYQSRLTSSLASLRGLALAWSHAMYVLYLYE